MPVLVLITGTGRSGTSTMSGTLHHLGLSVPGPHLQGNESNPRGFFENKWSVKFHNALNERAGVNLFDSRPSALARVQAAVTRRDRRRLREFLTKHHADQLVVKDPRTVFTQALWRETAAEVGLDIRYACMLRHPAEVVGSRTTYYASQDPARQHLYQITNVSRWVNASLISERETRGFPRSFIPYTDLLEDWRSVVGSVGKNLGLTYNVDLASGEPHEVDAFIEPSLRRHQVTWEDLDIPAELSRIAEDIWQCMLRLAEAHGVHPEASARMDELSVEFDKLLADTSAVCRDVIAEARAEGAAAARAEIVQAVRTGGQRRIDEVGGRELLRVVAGRARSRLRRS
jgi:hypothetical protein